MSLPARLKRLEDAARRRAKAAAEASKVYFIPKAALDGAVPPFDSGKADGWEDAKNVYFIMPRPGDPAERGKA